MSLTLPESIRSNFDDAVTRIETSIGVAKEYLQKQIDQLIIDDQLANQLKIFINDHALPAISGESTNRDIILSEEIALSLAVNYSYEKGIHFPLILTDVPADVLTNIKTGFLLVGGIFGALLGLQLLVKDGDKTLLDIGLTLSAPETNSTTGEVTFYLKQSTPEEYEEKEKVAKDLTSYIVSNITNYEESVKEALKELREIASTTISKIRTSNEAATGLERLISTFNGTLDSGVLTPALTEKQGLIFNVNGYRLGLVGNTGATLTMDKIALPSNVLNILGAMVSLEGSYVDPSRFTPVPITIKNKNGVVVVDSTLMLEYIVPDEDGNINSISLYERPLVNAKS